jgi:hypothetical protein
MNIGKLHTSESRYSVPAVHPRLAAIKASAEQRADLVTSARSSGAVIVGRGDVGEAMAADLRRREAAHKVAVEAQRARLSKALAYLEQAVALEEEAIGRRSGLTGAVADFDLLAADAMHADRRRNEAWADRRRALQLLVDAADQLEKVQVQRRGAAADLDEAQTQFRDIRPSGPADGETPGALAELQRHVSAVHAVLDKAESEQQAAARHAEQQLVSAIAGVADADAAMAAIWSRLSQTVAEDLIGRWGRGHPEAGMIAEHREALVSSGPSLEGAQSRAAATVVAATGDRDAEARRLDELDGPGAEPVRVLDAIRTWLASVVDGHADNSLAPAPVVLDNAFADTDPGVRAELMTYLIAASARTQLLYLTDQVDVLAWAISLPDDIGGLNHVATADRAVFALTD